MTLPSPAPREHHRASLAGERRTISSSLWHGYLPETYTFQLTFYNSGQLDMVSIANHTRNFANEQKYVVNCFCTNDFDFPYVSFRINFDAPAGVPIYTEGPAEVSAWGLVGGRLT